MANTWAELRQSCSHGDKCTRYGGYADTKGATCEMANACLNGYRQGRLVGSVSFQRWAFQRSMTFTQRSALLQRGALGLPRLYPRCMWPIGPCAPGCTAKHVDLDALDGARVAA